MVLIVVTQKKRILTKKKQPKKNFSTKSEINSEFNSIYFGKEMNKPGDR
jgi:hypothetical protein